MGAGDGSVSDLIKIKDAGPPSRCWNLVLVAEGYRSTEQRRFANDAETIAQKLLSTPPFSRQDMRTAINVYRLDVVSLESGADHPDCNRTGRVPRSARTYFDATFCWDGKTQRLLYGNVGLVQTTVEDHLPEWHQILVIVNDPERGGAGGTIGWFSNDAPDWREVAIHELGHSAFGLADEYDYDGPDVWPGGEPVEPNVTAVADPARVKWSALVNSGPASPTRSNPNCATTDAGPDPNPAGVVGTFEGARYSHCRAFRPTWNCMMRQAGAPFCPVCVEAILAKMTPFLRP